MCVSERKKQRHGLCVEEKIHECSKLCVFIYDKMSREDLKTGKWMFILVRSSLIVRSFVFPCLQKQRSSFLAGAHSDDSSRVCFISAGGGKSGVKTPSRRHRALEKGTDTRAELE